MFFIPTLYRSDYGIIVLETRKGGYNMNNRKSMISSLTMVVFLFVLAVVQFVRVSELTFLSYSPPLSGYEFILIAILLVILIGVVFFYIPLSIVLKWNVKIHISIVPTIFTNIGKVVTNSFEKSNERIYLRLNVIRC